MGRVGKCVRCPGVSAVPWGFHTGTYGPPENRGVPVCEEEERSV